MYLHDLIKIKYSTEGYLPNYPPHLISDKEMFDAFLGSKEPTYFYDTYELLNEDLREEYLLLASTIDYHIQEYKASPESDRYKIPDWVYSYMLGTVLHQGSDKRDKHLFLEGINEDNNDDDFTSETQLKCYQLSKLYINKLSINERQVRDSSDGEVRYIRVPTMFPEPHVLKLIRLNGSI